MMIDPERIFDLENNGGFETVCLDIFRYQSQACAVYARFIHSLGLDPRKVQSVGQIPFLPIEFFKTQRIVSAVDRIGGGTVDIGSTGITFTSSGTTGTVQSRHEVLDPDLYRRSFRTGFERFYGSPEDLIILALLPSYQERQGSSLIYMVDDLIRQSKRAEGGQPESGYFLHDDQGLYETLLRLQARNVPTLLLGVTYALLDFAERYRIEGFPALRVMETGGMKGRRREMIREEVHDQLRSAFGIGTIHSEYGMTELLSQAYSSGEGLFSCPPWMKILIRDTNDPFSLMDEGRTGGVNVIDLANLHSCSFIATQDLGRLYPDGRFEILGRFDHSDIRGCNLLIT